VEISAPQLELQEESAGKRELSESNGDTQQSASASFIESKRDLRSKQKQEKLQNVYEDDPHTCRYMMECRTSLPHLPPLMMRAKSNSRTAFPRAQRVSKEVLGTIAVAAADTQALDASF